MGRHEEYSKGYVGLQPQVEKLRLYGLCQDFDKWLTPGEPEGTVKSSAASLQLHLVEHQKY